VLPNGLKAYIAEDHSLPYIEIEAYVRGGAIFDPPGKEGLGALAAQLLRTGGTERYSADSIDKLLDLYSIAVSFRLGETDLELKASFLSPYADTALALLEQMMHHPAFDNRRFADEKSIYLQRIRHRFDNPEPLLDAASDKAMYPSQINSRLATEKSVGSLTREDCIAWHKGFFAARNMVLSAAGDFVKDSMVARLRAMFEPCGRDDLPPLEADIRCAPEKRCLIVQRNTTQSYVFLGVPFVKRPDPDYYCASVLNMILGGGGFTSRLGSRIRSDEGLTYSIHSNAGSNYVFPATWHVSFHTKSATTARAIKLTLEEIDKVRTSGVSERELADAKSTLVDALPSMFRTPADIVQTYAWNEYYGRDPDHYVVYPGKIRAVTADDCRRIATKYLQADSLTFVVVGDTARILTPQQAEEFPLGKITPRLVTLPDSVAALP
jgi:zinc protease